MPLSNEQYKLLDACRMEPELQEFLAMELGVNGEPKGESAPDFLYILCNMLQIAEHRLHIMRNRLAKVTRIEGLQGLIAEPPPDIATIETEIKHCWTQAAALWRAADLVVRNGEVYGVHLSIQHVEYALSKGNLPVVEMIRYVKPEYFEIEPKPSPIYYLVWIVGAILGGFIGFISGCRGGYHLYQKTHKKENSFMAFWYAIAGIFSGSAMGFMKGGQMGLRTGNLAAACRLASDAAYLNPFHDAIGSKYQQAVELRREEILFELSHSYLKKKLDMPTLSF